MPRKTQKQQVDLARMGVGASTSTLPSAPRARDPNEDSKGFSGRAAADAAYEVAEANQDWGSIRNSRSSSGPGFAGASASSGPSRADDSSNWSSIRGPSTGSQPYRAPSSSGAAGKYVPPSREGTGGDSFGDFRGGGGSSLRSSGGNGGRFAGLKSEGGPSAFGQGSGGRGGSNPAFQSGKPKSSAFPSSTAFGNSSSRRFDTNTPSHSGSQPGKFGARGDGVYADPAGRQTLSISQVKKANTSTSHAAAAADAASAQPAAAQVASHIGEDPHLVMHTLKVNWKDAVDTYSLDMTDKAVADAVGTLSGFGLPQFYKDAASLVITRAAKQSNTAARNKLIVLADALRKPRAGGALPLVKPSSVWLAVHKTLGMLRKNSPTLVENEARLANLVKGYMSDPELPLGDDAVFEAEEGEELYDLQAWATSHGLLGASGAGGDQAGAQVTAEEAVQTVLSTGKLGEHLAEEASKALKLFSREKAAAASTTAVLKIASEAGSLSNVRCPWADEEAYGAFLESVVDGSTLAGMASLFAVQAFLDAAGWPKGVIEGIFLKFYNEDICPNEAFTAWKEDTATVAPGRMTAIMQTNKWFGWFAENAAEESDDEEEEEEEEEDDELEGVVRAGKSVNQAVLF